MAHTRSKLNNLQDDSVFPWFIVSCTLGKCTKYSGAEEPYFVYKHLYGIFWQ